MIEQLKWREYGYLLYNMLFNIDFNWNSFEREENLEINPIMFSPRLIKNIPYILYFKNTRPETNCYSELRKTHFTAVKKI